MLLIELFHAIPVELNKEVSEIEGGYLAYELTCEQLIAIQKLETEIDDRFWQSVEKRHERNFLLNFLWILLLCLLLLLLHRQAALFLDKRHRRSVEPS